MDVITKSFHVPHAIRQHQFTVTVHVGLSTSTYGVPGMNGSLGQSGGVGHCALLLM
jgi:hypothetical protein